MLARLFVALQYVLPRHWLTAIVYRIAGIRIGAVKDALIRGFVRLRSWCLSGAGMARAIREDDRHTYL